MKNVRIWLIALLLVSLLLSSSGKAEAQTSDSVYVPETGHWIWGEFLRMYNSVTDPLLLFGYPITDDFTDPVTGQRVQYFQKVRFDIVDTTTGPQVQLAPLGQLLHETGVPLADFPMDGPNCRAFEVGYSVCYAFLQFFDSYGGLSRFGNPVSDVEVINGRYIQYFEYARMEWWPEKPAGQRVVLSDLGRIYFDKVVANPELLKSSTPANIAGNLLHPKVRVFSLKSLIGPGEDQTIFVIVQDQYLRPIQNAEITITLNFPDGSKEFYRLPESSEKGISQFSFTTGSLAEQSVVNIQAEVSVRGETATGRSWFRFWW